MCLKEAPYFGTRKMWVKDMESSQKSHSIDHNHMLLSPCGSYWKLCGSFWLTLQEKSQKYVIKHGSYPCSVLLFHLCIYQHQTWLALNMTYNVMLNQFDCCWSSTKTFANTVFIGDHCYIDICNPFKCKSIELKSARVYIISSAKFMRLDEMHVRCNLLISSSKSRQFSLKSGSLRMFVA